MAIEQPPTKDLGLAAYLVRAFTALQSSIDSVKTFFVLGEVKNPQAGKLYFVKTATTQLPTEGLYFFNGSSFVKLTDASSAVKLGVSHADAYYGDFGKAAYDHSNETGNPHGLSLLDIGLENVNNTSDKDKPISDDVQAAINGLVPTTRRINGQTLASDVTLGTGNINETFNRYYVSYSQRLLLQYSTNATTDGYLLGSDWVIFNGKQDALGFTPENVANKVIAWSSPTDTQYPSAKLVNDTFANYLLISSFHEYYKGKYVSLSALNTAWPVASAGDYAQVDAGIADSVVNYNWDEETGWVIGSIGSGATNTDGLPEGSTNFYFTEARVRATLLTGFSITTGAISSTDSVLTAFNKLAGNVNTKIAVADIHAATNKTTPVDADEFGIYDSVSGLLNKLTWANLKATLKTYFDTLYAVTPTTWTPTWTGITMGNAVVSYSYVVTPNKICIARLDVTFGTTTTTTGGLQSFTLPVASISRISVSQLGQGIATTAVVFPIVASYKSTSDAYLLYLTTGALSGAVTPYVASAIAWANGHKISLQLTYEVA